MTEENKQTETNDIPKVDKAKYDKALIDGRNAMTRAETLEAELREFKKIVSSPDEAFALKTAIKEFENKGVEKGEIKDIDGLVQKRVDEVLKGAKVVEEQLKTRAETAENKLHKLEVVDGALNLIKDKFKPEGLKVIKELYIEKFVKKDSEGNFIILDDKGQRRTKGADYMTLEDFTSEILQDLPPLAASTPSNNSRPGGEAKTGKAGGAGTLDPSKLKNLQGKEKIAYIRQFSTYSKQG